MAIGPQLTAEIRRLFFGEHHKVGEIARLLGVSDDAVRRAVDTERFVRPGRVRPSELDPYLEFCRQTLQRYPKLKVSRLHDMLRQRGYRGSVVQLRRRVRQCELRPRPQREAFFALRTLPGEQAQVDWGYFGQIRVGSTLRKLWLFVVVLSWSRAVHVSMFLDQSVGSVLRGHLEAFAYFGGVPRQILYDNMKTVVVERVGDAIRFHDRLLELSGHYLFAAVPCAPGRGNEKGRVEARIKDLRHSFMAGRQFVDLDDLRRQFEQWRQDVQQQRRCPEQQELTVGEALVHERKRLQPLPENALGCDDTRPTTVGKQPYVILDTNHYSVPHELVGEQVLVVSSERHVRVLHDGVEVAQHSRSYDRHQHVDLPEHLAALAEHKRKARSLHGRSLLLAQLPQAEALLMALAERNEPLGPQTTKLLELVQIYGTEAVADAVAEALNRGTPRAASVAWLLQQRERAAGNPPAIGPLRLSRRPELQQMRVTNHKLEDYDDLT
jgi:transposase